LEHRSSHVRIKLVAAKAHRTERRRDALSKERIAEAAIEILDTEGESALTSWVDVLKLTFDLHINVNVRHSME
jgi:hypothetical protein